MFIATAITNQSQLRRSETRRTLRSYGAVNVSIRVPINISSLRDLCVQETCSKNKKFDLCFTEKTPKTFWALGGPSRGSPSARSNCSKQISNALSPCAAQQKSQDQ